MGELASTKVVPVIEFVVVDAVVFPVPAVVVVVVVRVDGFGAPISSSGNVIKKR